MFVDKVLATFAAGDGGNGLVSFRREKFVDKGGPDGGDGGRGGNIILKSSRNQNTLAAFRYRKLLKAGSGQPGARAKKRGKGGPDLIVPVPVGTTVISPSGDLLADMIDDRQETVIAEGGRGGFGNAHFKSSTRQAPRIAEKGEKGQMLTVSLELKMIADVGLIGLPNAGKSTLISVISNARPEIADYPFTTLTPNLGVVDMGSKASLLFADIPGLIAGASHGKGLGDEFLRHVERTSLLVHLIDIYNEDVAQAYKTIIGELAAYTIDLSKRPQAVVLTKVEGVDKKELARQISRLKKQVPHGTPVLAISAKSGEGIKELLSTVQKRVEQTRTHAKNKGLADKLPVIRLKDVDSSWQVEETADGFIVSGQKIEGFARRIDFTDYYGQQRLRDILSRTGVIKELDRRGAQPGQNVIIGHSEIGRLEY